MRETRTEPSTNEWDDLRERLTRAAEWLDTLSRSEQDWESCVRLRGKRQGVLIAIDYMRGYHGSDSEPRP